MPHPVQAEAQYRSQRVMAYIRTIVKTSAATASIRPIVCGAARTSLLAGHAPTDHADYRHTLVQRLGLLSFGLGQRIRTSCPELQVLCTELEVAGWACIRSHGKSEH
jgi:hypothetical protein